MTDPQGENTELLVGDTELLARVRDGDTGAYEELYTRHLGAARGLARQLVRAESEVDDAVAETFARVLAVLGRGGGPTDGFRPYLLTALRHVVYDRFRGEKRQVVTDDMEAFDSGEPFVDPAVAGLERSLIARAYLSLPERWQAVLWYTEIEGRKPADAAFNLGMNPNSVAALAYRAREGLRQAYLQMHLAGGSAEACRPTVAKLGAYVRGGLAKRDSAAVDHHLDDCGNCREVCAELMDVNVGLRGIVLPLVAGPAAVGYLASVGGVPAGVLGWWQVVPKRAQQTLAGGAAVAAAVAALAFALVSNEEPVESSPQDDPPAAAGQPEEPDLPEQPDSQPPQPDPPADVPPADDPPPAPDEQEAPARAAARSTPAPEEEPAPDPPSEPREPPQTQAPPPEIPDLPDPPEQPPFDPPGAGDPPAQPPPFDQPGFDPPGAGDPPAQPPPAGADASEPGPAGPGDGPENAPGNGPPGLGEQEAPGPPGQAGAPGQAEGVSFAPGPAARSLRAPGGRAAAPTWTDACPLGDREWWGGIQSRADLVRLWRGLPIGPAPNAGRTGSVDIAPADEATGRGGVAWIAARYS